MKNAHILFLKYPEAGRVKTRLAKDIGADKAAEFYRLLTESIIMSCAVPDIDMLLFIEPYERLADFQAWLGDDMKFYPQTNGDLGKRMYEALRVAMKEGYDNCIITGSDIPQLNSDVIHEALEKMQDAVIGKSYDGGYYLIGFRKETLTDAVFTDMEWSTESVFTETMLRFENAGLKTAETYTLSDIDDINDLKKMKDFIEEILTETGIDFPKG